ncbi:hypothetical protein [Spirosoma spitsbergense]|uniref:hypothetical protein n=1 Tax=Spirosoma spitsbergense TaxID=431554 RepID=UPI000376BE45|nr:hypothetical protein [Spirosoma spitsbergense]
MPVVSHSLSALFALLTIAVAIWTGVHSRTLKPPNSVPASRAIISFEFARNAGQIRTLLVDSSGRGAGPFIRQVRYLTRLDFLFIAAYTLFVLSFTWSVGQAMPSGWLSAALVLAPVIGLFDVLENVQMLGILDKVMKNAKDSFQPELARLSVFTWIKWEATGLLMLLLVPFLWHQNYWTKGIAILSVGVFILGIIALAERLSTQESIVQAQRFANLVLITFAIFTVYVLVKEMSMALKNFN